MKSFGERELQQGILRYDMERIDAEIAQEKAVARENAEFLAWLERTAPETLRVWREQYAARKERP
jgi:hypothetical protein